MNTLIIAEAGVNHNGDIGMARQLIDAAAEAGADLVKFQTFRADRLVTTSAKKAAYQMATTAADESQHEMIRRLELSEAMHDELIAHCRQRKIEFFSTAFDLESLDYLMGLGMQNVAVHERTLRDYARDRLAGLNWLNVQGNSAGKGAIFSFTMQGAAHAHDLSTILDKRGIAVRAGTHCAMPLMAHLGVTASCRASFGLYNTAEEVDALVSALDLAHELFA